MSKTVDEKVVEMKFDNSHFEKNVQGTLSTLDKLKAKLNFGGAAKGFQEIENASKKVNLDGLANGIQTVQMKFSAMEVVGVTALANITNAAVDAAKNITMSLLGIPAMKAGFDEYQMTMNTVQTLVNSTGKNIDVVNQSLKELDEYADKTVYSTADMFNNIYKFTNAGVDLEDAKTAMIGIANATAYAGQGAQQASIAYYNLAQSMSMGYLTTIDFKSINLANIATKEFKERLAEAAVEAGTLKKIDDDLYSTGKKSYTLQALFTQGLSDQWATTEVMMDVFKQYGSQETAIGQKAWKAAQEVKTFSMMLETLRAQAGTGWKDTWQILFGDLDQAKRVWTGLTNFIGHFVDVIDNWRNRILKIAMDNPLRAIFNKINNSEALKAFQEVTDKVKQTSKTLEEYQDMVWRIWRGDFNNQPYREALVEAEGYSYGVTQSLVNLTAKLDENGRGWRAISQITEDDVIAVEKEFGIEAEEITETLTEQTEAIKELTDEQLEQIGLSKEEIKMYRQLEKAAKRYGISIEDIIKMMDEANGRDLLYGNDEKKITGAFQYIGDTITQIIQSIKKAWTNVFDGITGVDLYMLIAKFQKFTENIRKFLDEDDRLDKISRTFRGLFSAIHVVAQIISGPFKLAFQILKGILAGLNIPILDFTSMIGDIIYNFDRWITENDIIVNAVKMLTEWIVKVATATIDWVKNNQQLIDMFTKIKEKFTGVGESIRSWLDGLKDTDNIPEYIFGGLINGIKENGPKVWEAIKTVAEGLIKAIKDVLQIHSPSVVMIGIGGFIIAGLIAGIQQQELSLWDVLGSIGEKIIDFFKNINIGDIMMAGISVGMIFVVNKTLNLLDKLTAPLEGFGNMLSGLGNMLASFGTAAEDWGKGIKYQGLASIIKSFAIALGVLVAAIVILGKLPENELQQGAIALGSIIVVLGVFVSLLAAFAERLSKLKLPDIGKTLAIVLGVSAAILILSIALKNISKIPKEQIGVAIGGFIACIAGLGAIIAVLAGVSKYLKGTKNIEKLAGVFLSIAASMLIISVALRLMSGVQPEDIGKMILVIASMVGLLLAIGAINKFTNNSVSKASTTIMSVAGALLIMAFVMKISGSLKPEDFGKGIGVIGVFSALMLALLGISKIFTGTEMIKVGGSILLVSVALGAMALVMKLTSAMDPKEMAKGLVCIGVLSSIIVALILVSRNSKSFHGTSLIGVGVAILAMSGAVWLLGKLDPETAKKGLACVSVLSTLVAMLILVSKNMNASKNAVKSLTMISFMIAILAAAMIGLSFIDAERLIPAAIALTSVVSSLAATIFAVNKMESLDMKKFASLLGITLIIGALAGIVALLSLIPNSDNLIKSTLSLTILVGAVALLAYAFSKIKIDTKDLKGIAIGILAIAGMAIPLLAFVGVLQALSGIPISLDSILTLVGLVTAMTLLLIPLTVLGTIAADSAGTVGLGIIIGIASLAAMALALLPFVGVLQAMSGIPVAIDAVRALIELTSAMTLLLIPLTILGTIAIASAGISAAGTAIGIASLAAMALALGALVGILQAMDGIENATENANTLIHMAEKLTDMLIILSLISPFLIMADVAIAGLIGIIAVVGTLATYVGALMTKYPQLEDFLNKGLPILEQISLSIGVILGNFINGFMTAATANLDKIGAKLSAFAIGALPFITIMQSIDGNIAKGVACMVAAIVGLSASNVIESMTSFLSGGKSFARLGTELSQFAMNALGFIMVMNMVKPEVAPAAKTIAEAIAVLTAGNLLNSITSFISGKSDLAEFGNSLGSLGTGLSSFVTNLGTFTEEQVTTVEAGCNALTKIAEAADKIPKQGGIADFFAGTSDISEFAGKFETTAKAIKTFINELTKDGDFTEDDVSIVECGANALVKIAEAASKIPKNGGVNGFFAGDNDIQTFAAKLGDVAKSLRGFVWELLQDNVITKDAEDAVWLACDIITSISMLGDMDLNKAAEGLEKIGEKLGSMADSIKTFVSKALETKSEDLASAKEKIESVIEVVKEIADIDTEALSNFGDVLKTIGEESINKFIEALKGDDKPKTDAVQIISDIIDAMKKQVEDKNEAMSAAAKTLSLAATEALYCDEVKNKVAESGTQFVKGFENALRGTESISGVYDAAYKIGETAVNAINKATDVNSPSRETYKTGKFFDLGFINGIKEYSNNVYKESYSIGDEAKKGLTNAVSKVASIMNSEMDTSPTIRPVLDLSDIENGVGTLDSMFASPSVGVMSNLNAISSGISVNGQNGGEIVNAINKLRKDLGSVTSNTYNINGVTYDDGSEIQEAVGTLVRAARIERRM